MRFNAIVYSYSLIYVLAFSTVITLVYLFLGGLEGQ